MSKDGVVPPPGGPTRRPAGGPADEPGRTAPTGPVAPPAAGRNPAGGESARSISERPTQPVPAYVSPEPGAASGGLTCAGFGPSVSELLEADGLGAALRSRVAPIGAGGPPSGGLARVRHRARVRQRNRAALAGSAGVLVLAVAVTLATGDRFDIVPTLTGTAGNGGGAVAGGQADGSGADRGTSAAAAGGRVVWPIAGSDKKGPAIGPVPPVTGTPAAVAAAKVPLCTASTLMTSTTIGPAADGIVYGHVDAMAESACVVVGPPVLAVTNQAGTAAGSVLILKEDTKVAPALPKVSTWGTTMVLAAGQGFEFQFAWVGAQCPQSSGPASPSASPATSTTTYSLGYAVTGTTPTAQVTLTAACGADVFVTDIYKPSAYPLPTSATQSPAPSTSATAGPGTASPSVMPSTSSAPPSSAGSTSASPPPTSGTASGGLGTGVVGASPSG
jgi:hypothetical protein